MREYSEILYFFEDSQRVSKIDGCLAKFRLSNDPQNRSDRVLENFKIEEYLDKVLKVGIPETDTDYYIQPEQD